MKLYTLLIALCLIISITSDNIAFHVIDPDPTTVVGIAQNTIDMYNKMRHHNIFELLHIRKAQQETVKAAAQCLHAIKTQHRPNIRFLTNRLLFQYDRARLMLSLQTKSEPLAPALNLRIQSNL